ncbi:metallophosphoesterase [Acinetobacter sp.]|jgi:UDP-2,3-diacylglucosamine pyrophosphatase LpxH|uniref:metallophosphoesterase n=1 Tax=Acinetobacter sp. TaxID=472 RepID=UPI0028AAB489|nr:metallophosphoesterase [Acinetobacter sp.]
MIRILHFSDLHIHDNYDQNKVLKCFLNDIKLNGKYDLVICSGDIAAKGNFHNENISNFFQKIKEIVGENISVITCPGNHDVSLKSRKQRYEVNFSEVKSHEAANALFDDLYADPDPSLCAHLKNYNDIASHIVGENLENKIFFTKKIEINNKLIGVASLNSAWFTKGGGDIDYGKLFVAQHQVERAYDEIIDCDIKIATFHHPLDWLSPKERPYIQNALINNFDIFLCGHMHSNNVSSLATNLGNLFTSNTGCLYQTREYFNGYSIIEITEESIKTIAREYYDQRSTFDKSIRFSEDATSTFSFEKKKEITLISGEIISHINLITNKKLLSINSGVAPQELSTIFVEPPLSYTNEKEYYASERDTGNTLKKLVSLDSLYYKNNNIFFFGKRESGKSTLLNFLISNKYQNLHSQAQLGIVIDLEKARTHDRNITKATIITSALNFLDGNLNKKELISLLEAGSILIAFDNLNIRNKNDEKVIKDFMITYNLCRYIATSNEPEIIINDYKYNKDLFPEQIHIHSFKKSHTENLVNNWFSNDVEASKNSLKFVKKLIDQLNVPSTPFLISMLLWVVEKNRNNSHLFNEASVVQVLIEGLLNKFGEEKKREDFDSTNLSHFLKEFSYHLDQNKVTNISLSEFDLFKIKYFAERGLYSEENLRNELIDKGILYGDSATIGFKFDCFRSYFLAEKFNTNEEIWLNIIKENKIQNYSVEFEYYSGIHRDREKLLIEFHAAIKNMFSNINFNTDKLSLENDKSILLSATLFGDITSKIDSNSDKKDEVTYLDVPNKASIDHSISREKVSLPDDSEHYTAFVTLKTFASILRNSELVANLKLKKDSLDDLFTYWDDVFLFLLAMVKADVKKLTEDNLTTEQEQELTRFFTLMLTFVYSYVIVEKSSSPKMKTLFEEYFESNNTAHRTLAILCYIDIDIRKAIEVTKKSLTFFNNKGFYLQAIYIFYLHKYLENGRFNKSKEQANTIKSILAEISFTLSGQGKKAKSQIVSQALIKLEEVKKKANDETN